MSKHFSLWGINYEGYDLLQPFVRSLISLFTIVQAGNEIIFPRGETNFILLTSPINDPRNYFRFKKIFFKEYTFKNKIVYIVYNKKK